jgi:hypothetical protein
LYCPLAKTIWRRVEKIISKAQDIPTPYRLSSQNILFHKQLKEDHEVMLVIAGKYAISLLTRSVINRPKHPRVIDAFLRTQILQTVKAHVTMLRNVSLWLKIERVAYYVFRYIDHQRLE